MRLHFSLDTFRYALCASLIAFASSDISAKLTDDGYYRVQNARSNRYIYVLDDKGELNFQATTADLGAIELWLGQEKTISDPATVIYMTDLDGKKRDYDFLTQGTGVMAMIDHAVSVQLVPGTTDRYRIFGRHSGSVRYIGDGTEGPGEKGRVGSTQPASSEWVKWYIHPVTDDDSNCFGLTPDIEAGGSYYTSFYASFPFSTASGGMTVYYVSKIDGDIAVVKEIDGTVAGATPVIVKTSSALPAQNKLNLGGNASPVAGNQLKGVYFKNESLSHTNLTPYDRQTMRLFGLTSDGKPGFITSDESYLPRNKAYLQVPAGTPAQLRIMTEDEYVASVGCIDNDDNRVRMRTEGLTLHIDGLTGNTAVEVCNITGQRIYTGSDNRITLPAPGIYIARIGSRAYKFIAR